MPKKGRLGQFADLEGGGEGGGGGGGGGGLAKKRKGGVFEMRLIPQCTLCKY